MLTNAKDLKEQSQNLNVLYAEDEAILRESMQSTLSKFFKNVYVATNGQEAFEIYKKEDIDLVITDINMPIMTGIELIQSIHKYHDKADPYITVLSAHNESRILTTLINIGINSFLNKPIDKQLLTNSLYKSCKAINDDKLLIAYEQQIHRDLEAMERKNKILEQKLKQLALQTNKNVKRENEQKEDSQTPLNPNDSYYNTLLIDDKDELKDLSNELDNYIAMMFQSEKLNEDYLYKLSHVYKKYASVLNSYQEFFEVGTFLLDFSEAILTLENKFMQDTHQAGIYFESLQLTLENYRENIWNKEARNPKFYNASLVNDIQLVIDFLEEKEIQENEIDFF
jgi:YesN/AraC family two-component response regulator